MNKPKIQKYINYRYTKEFRVMSRQARKTLHNIADKVVDGMFWQEFMLIGNRQTMHNVFMLAFVRQKPVTFGYFTALPQNYFSEILKKEKAA